MDNHRLALWCWWQHIDESARWTYVHIDRHYDALWMSFNPWSVETLTAHRSDLAAFRAATINDGNSEMALYRWDTITSALWRLYTQQIEEVIFATADEGDDPRLPRSQHIKPWSILGQLSHLSEARDDCERPCIVDVDIDYFAWQGLDRAFGQVFADDYVRQLGKCLKAGLDTGRFGVVTVALSPSTTGTWELAERLLAILLEPFPEYVEFATGAP